MNCYRKSLSDCLLDRFILTPGDFSSCLRCRFSWEAQLLPGDWLSLCYRCIPEQATQPGNGYEFQSETTHLPDPLENTQDDEKDENPKTQFELVLEEIPDDTEDDLEHTDEVDEAETSSHREEKTKIPEIPANVLGLVIAPFISDRNTFNSFSMLSKEVYEYCKEDVIPPWPETMLMVRNPMWSVSFSPCGFVLAAGGSDGVVRLWDRRTGPLESLRGHLGRVYAIVFTPDGRIMVSGSGDGDVRIWDMANGEYTCKILPTNTPHIDCLAIHRDGRILASGGDGRIRLWDLRTLGCIDTLTEENRVVESVAFSPDGDFLASGTWGNVIRLWNLTSKECIDTLQESTIVHSIVYSPDGSHIASASDNRRLRVWNISSRDYYVLEGHSDSVWSVSFSPDGRHLVSGSDDGTVRVWSTASGKCTAVLSGHQGHSVYSVAFSSDSRTIASASNDGCIEIKQLS